MRWEIVVKFYIYGNLLHDIAICVPFTLTYINWHLFNGEIEITHIFWIIYLIIILVYGACCRPRRFVVCTLPRTTLMLPSESVTFVGNVSVFPAIWVQFFADWYDLRMSRNLQLSYNIINRTSSLPIGTELSRFTDSHTLYSEGTKRSPMDRSLPNLIRPVTLPPPSQFSAFPYSRPVSQFAQLFIVAPTW